MRTNFECRYIYSILLLLLLLPLTRGHSQCTITEAQPIPDNGQATILFYVSGLIDGDLSSPAQGVCGVEIDFRHEYVGDLTVTLISPAGTMVTLIGPQTAAISPTNLSRWNIAFVPCSETAMPDPGFSATWSNNQAWQVFTPYSGTYYPHTGCLENFNTGSANGLWQVVVRDHDEFQTGMIAGLTLIFCNPLGLACEPCEPHGGILQPASISVCTGENIQSSDITIDFGGNIPSPASYRYEYLLIAGNTILQSGSSFSTTLPPGVYSICGISYAISDAVSVSGLLSAADYDVLSQAVDADLVCASLSDNCIPIFVQNIPDTTRVEGTVCNGEVFTFRGLEYSATGVYHQVYDGPGLCDTVFEVRVGTRPLSVQITGASPLDCADTLTLRATAGGASGPFSFLWSTLTGNMVTPVTADSVLVDQPGQYTVFVSDGICSGTGNFMMAAGEDFPQVLVNGGTLSCSRTSVAIHPVFVPSMSTVEWSGPSGFTAAVPDITVTVPGTYYLAITSPMGCTATWPVEVYIDTITMPADVVFLGKDCQTGVQQLGHMFPNPYTGWLWEGPGNFTSSASHPLISDPGLYTFTGTFPNGCTRSASIFFDGDFTIPDLSVPVRDTLNCGEVIELAAFSSVPGVTYSWSGPQHFSSDQPVIEVTQEGIFNIVVVAPNGCRNTSSVVIDRGDDIFDFVIITDTLDCLQDSVIIGVMVPDGDLFEWIDYTGPGAATSAIQVGAVGTYQVMVTDTQSGCEIIIDVYAAGNFSGPPVSYTAETITCLDPVATLTFVPITGVSYINAYWRLPDQTIIPGGIAVSASPGVHTLFAVGENGCTTSQAVSVQADTGAPFLITESGTLGCFDTLMIGYQTLNTILQAGWDGPGIVDTGLNYALVELPGVYTVTVTAANGCTALYSIEVDSNFAEPVYTLLVEELGCDGPAKLEVIPGGPGMTYVWYDPEFMQVISTDSAVEITEPGIYPLVITGPNGCTAADTGHITPPVYPEIIVTADTFTCTLTSAQLAAEPSEPSDQIVWLDPFGDTISTSPAFMATAGGPFIVSATGENRCETRDTIAVPYDTMPPVADIRLIGELRCQMREVMLDGSSSAPEPLAFSWTTLGGHIESDPAQPVIMARDTGVYSLVVRRQDNGCIDSAAVILTEHPEAILSVSVEIRAVGCSGERDGEIEVTGLNGGSGPFRFSLDGGIPQVNGLFDRLQAGIFVLTVFDSEGCEYDTTLVVSEATPFTVDAGPDQEIHIGESAALEGMTSLAETDISSDQWATLSMSVCEDCLNANVQPLETTAYILSVTSAAGCTVSDTLIVYVQERPRFFIPNIFTPNGDNINDEVRIFAGPGVEKVIRWVIFDRWGNAVYGKTGFDPADPVVFWNGTTSTGGTANPGVFVYLIEMELITGKRVLYHGDITLLR